MSIEQLVQSFLSSDHGQAAMAALQEKGINPADAQGYLSHAATAVASHAEDHAASTGILGDHPGRSFFAAFASGLLKGDGVIGSLEDGAAGVVTARVVEALCERAGVDTATAEMVAAAATPYAMGYIKSHLGR
jgi:hypothetical protein